MPLLLLNVAVYWQSSNTKVCDKKLSKRKNIENGWDGDWSQNLCEVLSKKINEK